MNEDDLYSDEYDELLRNGMFRNEEGIPVSGSNADFKYDDEEYLDFAKQMNVLVVEVHRTAS